MRWLLDTRLLLWAAQDDPRFAAPLKARMEDEETWFSVVSIWEVAIKHALRRPDFPVDPTALREGLLRVGYHEIEVSAPHVITAGALPLLHRDPFDRLLVAQARVEGLTLASADAAVQRYEGVYAA